MGLERSLILQQEPPDRFRSPPDGHSKVAIVHGPIWREVKAMREEERRSLAATERQLEAEDPELARLFRDDPTPSSQQLRITLCSGALLALAVLCVVLGQWFAVLQSLALAGAFIWLREGHWHVAE